MHGYLGRILRVDLGAGKLRNEPLSEAHAHAFVGGSGLAARYLDLEDGHADPLAG